MTNEGLRQILFMTNGVETDIVYDQWGLRQISFMTNEGLSDI